MDQANLWTRRNKDKISLPTRDIDTRDSNKIDSPRSFGVRSSHGKSNPFSTASPASAKSPSVAAGGSSAFGLGTGAFASFGQAKTPKTPGTSSGFDFPAREKEKKESERERDADSVSGKGEKESTTSSSRSDQAEHGLKHIWNIFYRPPTTSRDKDYEKSIIKIASIGTIEGFWTIYSHLRRPSDLPTVSDYHIFRDGIRPVWEDISNKKGGKWIIRLKKGVADRYWEELLVLIVGDQFVEASDEVCGAVLSVRSGEDVLSVWTRIDGGRNIKIRETIKRVLALPADTNIIWRSHDESIEQKKVVDEARQQKGTGSIGVEKRRTSQYSEDFKTKTVTS